VHSSGDVVFSFRSVGDFDVSALAKRWGGGGHKNASGAKLARGWGYTMLDVLYSNALPAT
jgi:nanoRNase/pAp phosphatase (c-di-AMP/oligoRNAs hydrolase)